jgi:hypothetical protein
MTIWLLTVLLLASLAGLGLRQGLIRVAFSLAGILAGALLANPLAHLVRPALTAVGIRNPIELWLMPPVIVFIVVLVVFKIAAFAVHRKVDLHFKYKAADLRLTLWRRMNSRLGMCLALVNGAAYLVLISFVIYILSYWTVQVASGDADRRGLKILNRMGKDLESTGMAKVGRAIDRMPPAYYKTADIVGEVYHTPLLESRLERYPPFLGLAEQADFQGILNDKHFTELWQRQPQPPIIDLIRYPSIAAMLKNGEGLKSIWAIVEPDLDDLEAFLINGVSPKYDPVKILGRWDFAVNPTIGLLRKSRPNIPSSEMARVRKWMTAQFATTSFVAMTDHQLVLKNLPQLKTSPGAPPSTKLETLSGQWSESDGRYVLNYSSGGKSEEATAEIQGDRLVIAGQRLEMAFERED